MKKKNKIGSNTIAGIAILFGITLFIAIVVAMVGFDTVEASHKGVKVRLGEITGIMNPGLQWTGLFTTVHQYDLRTRKMSVNMMGAEGAVDKDGQSIYATIEINYKLNGENVENAYAKIGLDNSLSDTLRLEGIVKEGFKTVTSHYSSLEIFQKRQEVKDKAIEQIQSRFPQEYFSIENVIISNIDFNPDFKAAIEQKKVAEEMAKAKEQEVSVYKFEADKQIETARGESESKKLQAEAEAYQKKVLAESRAFEITEVAKAEAVALELKAKELTPLMIQNNYIDAWDGTLPKYMLSSDLNMLMQMPME